MDKVRRGSKLRSATITFNMPKALNLSDASSQVYTIGPWLHFVASERVREVASRIENDVWVETLDGLPPETLLLIEHGSTLRVAIDIGENTKKELVKKAYDVAKKWQEVIRDFQGYRVDDERDAFFANLERAILVPRHWPLSVLCSSHKSNTSHWEEQWTPTTYLERLSKV